LPAARGNGSGSSGELRATLGGWWRVRWVPAAAAPRAPAAGGGAPTALGGGDRVEEHRWKLRKGSRASIWAEEGQRGVLHGGLGAAAVCSGVAALR